MNVHQTEVSVPYRPRLPQPPPPAALGLAFPFGAAAAAATTMLSGYLGTSRGDHPRAQVSHILQRRLSYCPSERERQRLREYPDREEEDRTFLHQRRNERLSDGEDDSFGGGRGATDERLIRSASNSPLHPNGLEETDDGRGAAAGDNNLMLQSWSTLVLISLKIGKPARKYLPLVLQ